MKTYYLAFTIAITIVSFSISFGKIKNGYSVGIVNARESLRGLNALLQNENEITSSEKRAVETRIKEVVNYIVYYELTEILLNRFRSIAPNLYGEVDTLRDAQGRSTDVYIRFIPEEQARVQAWGITNIAKVQDDHDAYLSEFGEQTVSVKIWVVNKSLMVLAHELGHVKYQVPHLATYCDYYKMTYRPGVTDANNIGHETQDPSGKNATLFEKVFRENYARYLKNGNEEGESLSALKETIRKQVQSPPGVAFTSL